MKPQRFGQMAALVAMVATGWYVFVYLYRWEWNRALLSGVLFLAAEVGLVGMLIISRLQNLDRRVNQLSESRERITRRLHENRPDPHKPFAWLAKPGQMNVFVPVLLGAGVLLSALAWVVERIARATAGPVIERDLTAKLGMLSLPEGGFLGEDSVDLLRRPRKR